MSDPLYSVLVLCTGNSARSVLAECLLNDLGQGRWKAYSAGSHPTGVVNPLSLVVLREHGHNTEGLRSKSWDEFAQPGAPALDLVMTVCDNAASEVCPVWLGHPNQIHIGFPDPAAAEGSEEERLDSFRQVYAMIKDKVQALIAVGPERAGDIVA